MHNFPADAQTFREGAQLSGKVHNGCVRDPPAVMNRPQAIKARGGNGPFLDIGISSVAIA
jgi:hypothetical protein